LSELRVRLVGAQRRDETEAAWRAVEAAGPVALACSWRWTETWLRHYGDVVSHRFAIADREGEPVAAALVTRSGGSRSLKGRTLHLGTAGEPPGESVVVEHNALASVPEHRDDFARALLARLRRERGWQRLALDGFAPATHSRCCAPSRACAPAPRSTR